MKNEKISAKSKVSPLTSGGDLEGAKFRISPLNFATAFFLVLAVYTLLNGAWITGAKYQHLKGTITLVFLLFAFVIAFLDIMLRNFFRETKNLWIAELSFITLTTILFLLVK